VQVSINSYCQHLKLMGHRVAKSSSTVWVDVRPFIYQPATPFQMDTIRQADVDEVLQSANAIACRWFSPLAVSEAAAEPDPLVVYIARPPFNLETLRGDARRKTRRGLERVEVRKASLSEEVEALAYPIYVDNIRRVGLMNSRKRILRRWQTWAAAIRGSQCVDFWTAWNETTLLAFMVAVRTPWGTQFVLHRSAQSSLPLYPNNALYYQATKDAFDSGSPIVSTGLSAFAREGDGLHEFKIRMGFEAVPLREKFAWCAFLRPFESYANSHRLRKLHAWITRARQLSGTF